MFGKLGGISRVDLKTSAIWDEPLNEDYARDCVGGSGVAARYLVDLTTSATDPIRPEDPLIFMTGPFVGMTIPAAGRCDMVVPEATSRTCIDCVISSSRRADMIR